MATLAADPRRSVLITDFDGTIAEIVADPATARPLPGVVEDLAALSAVLRTLAVVSGRPASFLSLALGLATTPSSIRAFGLYGLEAADPNGTVHRLEVAGGKRAALAEVAAEARAAFPDARVEDKGQGVVLHYREAPELGDEVEAFARRLAERHGLSARPGRMSIELLPPGASDKGDVVRLLASEDPPPAVVAFIGDDLGDVSGFLALAELREKETATIAVAVRSPESPESLISLADVVLDGPRSTAEFLHALAEAVVPGR